MRTWLASVALVCAFAHPVAAQLDQGIESWARAVTGVTTSRWVGERVPFPTPQARPSELLALRSLLSPVAVHVPSDMPRARAQTALEAVEDAYVLLEELGWQVHVPDGDLGGDGSVDVYLSPHLEAGARAAVDASEPFSYLDAASSFGLADARVPAARLEGCVTSAYVQALLMARDPSEAESVRRAAGAYMAWLLTGELGCDDAPLMPWTEPWRGVMGTQPDASGAGLFAMLGWRQDQNRGLYVPEIWNVARQRTWEGHGLRGSPDTWQALETILDVHREEFAEVMDELSVARYLVGPQIVAGADRPPLSGSYDYSGLPVRTRATDPPLERLGAAYYLVDTREAPDEAALRIWLRGEYGVHWALSAVRLSEEGEDLGRVSAPARDYPRSYLALVLDEATAEVLIVVTNLSNEVPNADAPRDDTRAAHLVIDKGAEAAPQ